VLSVKVNFNIASMQGFFCPTRRDREGKKRFVRGPTPVGGEIQTPRGGG